MKRMNKSLYISWLFLLLIGFTACESFLEEENYDITAETFYNQENADNLVVATYQGLRTAYKQYATNFLGTDMFTQTGQFFSVNTLNEYVDINSSSANGVWDHFYHVISNANSTINRYENQISWEDAYLGDKAYGIAQAKGLRALAYFNLVQQYGGVVLELDEVSSIRNDYTRASEAEVYQQIIDDLEAAIPDLKDNPDFGRFSKRAAQHLLAEVYLTRGYTSFGSASDFTTAANYAESAIGGYDIRTQTFAEVFDYNNQQNAEVLFSVQYGEGLEYDDRNNNKHALFMNSVLDYVGIARTNPYGRQDGGMMPTTYFYSLFADNDTREEATLHRVLYANEVATYTSENGSDEINPGDTVVYYPKEALSAGEIADMLNRYWVFNPDQYYYGTPDNVAGAIYQYSSNVNRTNFPIFKKFDDQNFDESQGGYRDAYVFRVAGSHLVAAEAYLQAGNSAQALSHINRVRERATGVANHYSSVTIEDVLDERALELAGETSRWNTLKRTGTLQARIGMYNPHVADHGKFDAGVHLLRPIPAHELELSDGSLEQNPGY